MNQLDDTTPDASGDARRLLAREHYPCEQIIRVDRDSILFVTPRGRVKTAWLHLRPSTSRVMVRVVEGFAAEPPDDWPPEWAT